MPDPDYLSNVQSQTMDKSQRKMMVEFIINAWITLHRFGAATLHLAIRNMDRFLSVKPMEFRMYKVIGITLLFNASKNIETYECIPSAASMLSDLSNNGIVRQKDNIYFKDITKNELRILEALKWDNMPTTNLTFIRGFINSIKNFKSIATGILYSFCEYLSILTLYKYEFVEFCPSTVSAGILYYAITKLHDAKEEEEWAEALENVSHVSIPSMKAIAKDVQALHDEARKEPMYIPINERYELSQFHKVSMLSPLRKLI